MKRNQRHFRDLPLRVDRTAGTSVGRQLEDQLREAIRSGKLTAGATLPSTRALAEDLEVSRGVIVRAFEQLASEGYLDLRKGALARIRQPPNVDSRRPTTRGPERFVRFDLSPHRPELSLFPRNAWLRSVRNALSTATDADLGYGDPCGSGELRLALADYLRRARNVVADPENVVITAGTTHALGMIARALAAKEGTRRFGFENPSQLVLHEAVRKAGYEPVGIPLDEHGLCVADLKKTQVDAVIVSPAHQFPTGVVLSPERRTELVEWARVSESLVIEDDYDAEFRYDRAPTESVQQLDPEHFAYLGTTGKTLAPAIRLGWAILPPSLVRPVALEVQINMINLPGIEQLALADFLRRGEFERHLRKLRSVYRARRDAMIEALAIELPELLVRGIAAGLHVVVELPSTDAAEAVVRAAAADSILMDSLSQHTLPDHDGPAGVIIGYGNVSEATMPYLVARLSKVVSSVLG